MLFETDPAHLSVGCVVPWPEPSSSVKLQSSLEEHMYCTVGLDCLSGFDITFLRLMTSLKPITCIVFQVCEKLQFIVIVRDRFFSLCVMMAQISVSELPTLAPPKFTGTNLPAVTYLP